MFFSDEGFFGGNGGGFFGNPLSPFSETYICQPMHFSGKHDQLEQTNKIILPPSALDQLTRRHISYPMLFEITSLESKCSTHCGVIEFSAEEGVCFAPYWLMKALAIGEGTSVKIANVTLPKGNFVKLQPLTSNFLDITDPKVVLENALRHFATLTKGEVISIFHHNIIFEIEIADTKPSRAISIIDADVSVDFLPPKDYVEPPRQPKVSNEANDLVNTNLHSDEDFVFTGNGVRLDGKPLKSSQQSWAPALSSEGVEKSRNLNLNQWGDRPWEHRIVGGVIVDKPYGFRK